MQIVDGIESCSQNFIDLLQVVQICARKAAAGHAAAAGINRPQVVFVLGVADLYVAIAGKEPTVAGVARGHHAVEHVDAAADAFNQILGRSHAHQIARLFCGHFVHDGVHDLKHLFFRLAHGQAAHGIAMVADVGKARQRLLSEMRKHAALHNAKERIWIFQPVELIAAAARPAKRKPHGVCSLLFGCRTISDHVGRAFVKDHRDVGIKDALNLHGDFRRQKEFVAVDRRSKTHAFFGDLSQLPEAKNLKAA